MARFDDGDVLIDEVKKLAKKEGISTDVMVLIGACGGKSGKEEKRGKGDAPKRDY